MNEQKTPIEVPEVFEQMEKARQYYETHRQAGDDRDWMGLPKSERREWAIKAGAL